MTKKEWDNSVEGTLNRRRGTSYEPPAEFDPEPAPPNAAVAQFYKAAQQNPDADWGKIRQVADAKPFFDAMAKNPNPNANWGKYTKPQQGENQQQAPTAQQAIGKGVGKGVGKFYKAAQENPDADWDTIGQVGNAFNSVQNNPWLSNAIGQLGKGGKGGMGGMGGMMNQMQQMQNMMQQSNPWGGMPQQMQQQMQQNNPWQQRRMMMQGMPQQLQQQMQQGNPWGNQMQQGMMNRPWGGMQQGGFGQNWGY
jgi:hypothetical protein